MKCDICHESFPYYLEIINVNNTNAEIYVCPHCLKKYGLKKD